MNETKLAALTDRDYFIVTSVIADYSLTGDDVAQVVKAIEREASLQRDSKTAAYYRALAARI